MKGLSVDEHLARSEDHYKIGKVLADVKHEWAAVALFYSAYHLVRHGLRTDPIFDDEQALLLIDPKLAQEHQDITRHHGRYRGLGREWGMIELTLLLYRPVAGKYDKLHQLSNEVRYGRGKLLPTCDAMLGYHAEIQRFHENGQFRAVLHTSD